MARRLPGIRGRMESAAVDLFAEQGYAATTAAQIAARAGTTERTFFRHFREKADAAFGLEPEMQRELVDAVRGADPAASAWRTVYIGCEAAAKVIAQDLPAFRARAGVVAANAELRDRELAKVAAWPEVVTPELVARGVPEADAATCATLGLTLFRLTLMRWAATPDSPLDEALADTWRTAETLLLRMGVGAG